MIRRRNHWKKLHRVKHNSIDSDVVYMSFGYQACKYYRRRFQIEAFFSDQKSRGFHLHKSHLADPTRLSRLLLFNVAMKKLEGYGAKSRHQPVAGSRRLLKIGSGNIVFFQSTS
jgi:hypothetical protein